MYFTNKKNKSTIKKKKRILFLPLNQLLIRKTLQIKHTTQTVNAKVLASLDGHGSFACEIKYLAPIVSVKRPYTIS